MTKFKKLKYEYSSQLDSLINNRTHCSIHPYEDGYIYNYLVSHYDIYDVDFDRVISGLMRSGYMITRMNIQGRSFHGWCENEISISKKHLKRWIKQNINRCRSSKTTLIKHEEELNEIMFGNWD